MQTERSRLECFGPFVLAGILRSHPVAPDGEPMYWPISAQWRELAEVAHSLPILPPPLGYGIGLNMAIGAPSLDYFCGFVVPGKSRVPEGFACLEIPILTCAVFRHTGHVSHLRFTLEAIFSTALSVAGLEPAGVGTPAFIQRYGETFDPDTGLGGFDVLVPVKE